MSWDIYMYAEIRNKDSQEWKPLCDRCICDNFKFYGMDFCDSIPRMKAKDSSHPYVKELSVGGFGQDFTVGYCYLKELRKFFSSKIDNFNTQIKAVYSALGVSSLCIDDEEYWCDEGDESEYTNDTANANPWVKYMTFPVNKKMLCELAAALHEYNKAMQVMGICDTISSMCENYDDEVRLLFATL